MSTINLYNCDNMEFMKNIPDKYYDLAIVDPPYGLGDRLVDGGTKKNPMQKYRTDYENKRWDIVPTKEYFDELFRVSKNQIIWGANYFLDYLTSTRGIICWDKLQMMETLSRWEFAWTSFDKVAKTYEHRSQDLGRIHINQKPVQLYKWLLKNYATCVSCENKGWIWLTKGKQTDCPKCKGIKPKILDTHGGSMSIAIACYDLDFDLDICELDKDYYDAGVKRFEQLKKQASLF